MTVRPIHPTHRDVMEAWLEQHSLETHTSFPARVEHYDAATQLADLTPLIRHPVPQPDGTTEYEDMPVLPAVPVVFPRTITWFLSLPIATGDVVLVVCCESALGHWHAGDGSLQYPGDLRRHDLSHAVAIPGIFPRARALTHASSSDLVLGKDDGSLLRIKPDGTVEIAGSVSFVALADQVSARLNELKTAINSWTPVPNDGGAALKAILTTLFVTWPTTVASATVKAG